MPGGHLSAASGLVRIGGRVHVIADDENSLGSFDVLSDAPGRLYPLFDGDLPAAHDARKAAKPDVEALLRLPPAVAHPHGALLAMGSGSRPARRRAALVALDADGCPRGAVREVDLTALYQPLQAAFGDLNIEGAFIHGGQLCLLQRGSRGSPVNACIGFDWRAVERWLMHGGTVPPADRIARFELGSIGGVPLGFTDGAALPDAGGKPAQSRGGWVFCAAAEDTGDSYADGVGVGSAVGIVDADGRLVALQRLAPVCKVEGIAVADAACGNADSDADGDAVRLLLVTDADDRRTPARLLGAVLTMNP